MTRQSRKILGTLKKCQPREGGYILVACDEGAPCSFTNDDTGRRVPSPYDSDKTLTVFAFLQARGLIEYDEPYGVKVTHSGWHTVYAGWERLRDFLVKSVLVPIVVTVLTALVLRWLGL